MIRLQVDLLRKAVSSNVWTGDEAITKARSSLWNAAANPQPLAFIECRTVHDVQQAVRIAGDSGVGVGVLGGGHDWAGRAACKDGFMLDLRALSAVQVDARSLTVRVGGGALTKDLVNGLPEGLVAVTGTVSTVGVAGLTLGGGYGKLNSRFGLAIDALRSADIVLANGSVVTASASEVPELLWALRGGGGNFGAVTSLTFDVFNLPSVLIATIFVPLSSARSALLQLQLVLEESPEQLSVFAALMTLPSGERGLMLGPLWSGAASEGEEWMTKLSSIAGAKVLAQENVAYPGTFDEQAEKAYSSGLFYHMDAQNVAAIDEDVADVLIECASTFPSPGSCLLLHDFHGAPTRVPINATAFPLRRPHFNVQIVASWASEDRHIGEQHASWLRNCTQELSKLAIPGGYVNLVTDKKRVRAFYGTAADRLQAIKNQFDPHDLFRSNVGRF